MKFKHFILSLLFLLTGRFAAAASDSLSYEALSDSLLQDVIRQFEVIHRYNTRNDELGRSDKNIYMITFQPGQEIYADANNILYFNVFNESPAGGHPSLVSENFKNEMNARLVEFNGMQPSQRRAVTMYGFILENYYLDVDSDFLRSYRGNVDLAAYWKKELEATTEAKRKAIIERNKTEHQTKIKDRLDQLIKNKLSEINVLVHSIAYWSSTKWALPQAPQSRQNYWVTIHGWNSNSEFVINNSEARELYRSSMRSSRVYPVFADRDERYIFHNIVSEIEFLTNPDIVAQFNRPCGEQLHIWRDHPMVSDPAHPYYARIQENPCLLKTIILQTHIPTDEHSRFEAKGCHIVFKDEWLIAQTAPRKLTDRQNMVNEAKAKLTALIQGSNTYVYAPSMNEKSREVLNDKFITYNKYVPDKKIFFLHLSLPFFLTTEEKQLFANDVATAPGFTAANMTLFVVPYFSHIYIRNGHCSSTENNVRPMYYYFPAVAGYDADGIRAAMLPNDMVFNLETDYGIPLGDPGFYASCLNLYKRVNKPYVQVHYFLRVNGHVDLITNFNDDQSLQEKLHTHIRDKSSSIIDFRVFYDKNGLDDLEATQRNYAILIATSAPPQSTANTHLSQYQAERLERLQREQALIFSSAYDVDAGGWTLYTQVRLRESHALKKTNGIYNFDLYCRSLLDKIYNGSFLNPELLSFGISEEALYPADWSEVIYTVIDVASVVAAFYGLDVVPELFGFCYAAYRGDVLRMGVYGAAAIVPMSNAFTPGKLAKYGKILKNGVWRAHPQALIDEMANRFGLINNRVAGMIQAADGLARRRAVKLMLREDLVDELMLLPSPDVRVKFLEDFLDLSPRGNNFAQHILGKPRLVKAWGIARRAGLEPEIRLNVSDLDRISTYQAATSKSSDAIVAEIESSAITAAGSTRSWLDNIPSGGGLQTGARGDYVVRESAEIFYRGLSESDYQHLLNTGQLRPTSETFTSPSLEYIQAIGYGGDGRIVKFYANHGTLDALESVGVRNDATDRIMGYFPDMPHVTTVSGWTQSRAMFKTEGRSLAPPVGPDGQINIGLGRGTAIDIFNQNLKAFEVVQ